MADYGLKITKSGEDVSSAADKDLILSTKNNMFKVAANGQTTVAGYSAIKEITHSLGYEPNYLVYIEKVGTSGSRRLTNSAYTKASSYVDDTKLYVKNNDTSTRTFYYYIMYDPL